MPDYGHELLFSVSFVPSAHQADTVVALTQLAERAGLDLVTFSDHPYQPTFLDTWTLLGYVAAATESIRLAGNVHPLPLRPPAMLAQAAASLDILSRGRFELALGTGGYWDAIASMGAPRLTPGQAVDALEEAIPIIRAAWDTDAPGAIAHHGEHYQVTAPRGPRPAHDIGIWLGAYKPRMLRVTGRLADGWLPSLPRLQSIGELGEGNTLIDEAAAEAGRSPRDIRRLLNLGEELPAAQLAEIALTYGVSAFILAVNDPDRLQRFAQETAPAVRELVAAERTRTTPPQLPSTATARNASDLAATPTPDDGVRLTDVRVWDETTRPTGPAPDPTRRYTPAEQANGRHLIDVHDHLRGELAQLRDLIDQVASGAIDAGTARSHINTMTMRQNNWTLGAYCESYCRLVTMHHTAEDAMVFPHLRRSEPALAPVLDRLQEEHHAIHKIIERVDRALVSFVGDPDGLGHLRETVDLLTDSLLSHLSYEERELVEPLARHGL
ncbi:LLM class flavin-dependent oxidoreductase [Nonomuraea jabiensis]|uniref:Alkanesulfonate monooxygenase SsuD/methylene tetrahydromethanopterin reductase-like flavin-dependent oxidoreductase (Luciferase family) n=1 Tax=Nonomuraea jabiensis TaxID=882448 RepID=A0A7W9LGK9_9ACTN|nr:LLM class flavin-dependent oxidoreductase [Nonomuraea jabiensis]MBB5782995.1 alkanesulfonate monooxygenase SsuD/methylene tetrahydromethanopterin reductase-like flavin-dependent oxidoreductase (luciferase family) [Nonomuraea jabiensis]